MPLELARIQALCFDVDGTLNDTDDQFVDQAVPYFRAVRWLLPRQDYQRAARHFVMWAEAPGNLLMGLPDRFDFDDQLARMASWLNKIGGPISAVMSSAIEGSSSPSRAATLASTSPRSASVIRGHGPRSNAARAAATARLMSPTVPSGTVAITCSV